uniref:Uncharacterized protein n=1 Tax=Schizaphis graminum TaxID=13262 RepID=A0A2S2P4K8_SCHGA
MYLLFSGILHLMISLNACLKLCIIYIAFILSYFKRLDKTKRSKSDDCKVDIKYIIIYYIHISICIKLHDIICFMRILWLLFIAYKYYFIFSSESARTKFRHNNQHR